MAGGRALDPEGDFVEPIIVCDMPDDAWLVREEGSVGAAGACPIGPSTVRSPRAHDVEFRLGGSVRLRIVMGVDSGGQHQLSVRCYLAISISADARGGGEGSPASGSS